jgi:hypothetical protein
METVNTSLDYLRGTKELKNTHKKPDRRMFVYRLQDAEEE